MAQPQAIQKDVEANTKTIKNIIKKAAIKKKGFPDVSGDGEVTKKDILIAKGVLTKKKK